MRDLNSSVYTVIYARSRVKLDRCSSLSPHSSVVLHPTWLEQTAMYSLILELQIGMQTVGRSPIRGSGVRSNTVYIPMEFNGEFAAMGNPRHPERDIMYLINIPYIFWTCWERVIDELSILQCFVVV